MSNDAWRAKAADAGCEQYMNRETDVRPGDKCFEVSLNATVFSIDEIRSTGYETLNLIATYKPQTGCSAEVTTHKCAVGIGIVEYAVELTNVSIALQHGQRRLDKAFHFANNKLEAHMADFASLALQLTYPPVEVKIIRSFKKFVSSRGSKFQFCAGYDSQVCKLSGSASIIDTSEEFSVLPHNSYISDICDYAWRDPMEV
jgi:hypothetical protein